MRRLRRLDAERKREEAEWEEARGRTFQVNSCTSPQTRTSTPWKDVLETGQEDGSATIEDL